MQPTADPTKHKSKTEDYTPTTDGRRNQIVIKNPELNAAKKTVRIKKNPSKPSINSSTSFITSSSMKIKIKIQGCPAIALIDTGASITAMDKTFFDKYLGKCLLHKPDNHPLSAANESRMDVKGFAKLNFQINRQIYPFKTYIIKSLQNEVIIGADFLKKFDGIINLESSTLKLKDTSNIDDQLQTAT